MPGHIKKSDGPDPDPAPWLEVSPELKVKLKAKPYDPKKSCWVPNKATHGYDEGLIDSTDGDKVTVMILESKEVKWPMLLVKMLKGDNSFLAWRAGALSPEHFNCQQNLMKYTNVTSVAIQTCRAFIYREF